MPPVLRDVKPPSYQAASKRRAVMPTKKAAPSLVAKKGKPLHDKEQ
jgi:hypothetical protein